MRHRPFWPIVVMAVALLSGCGSGKRARVTSGTGNATGTRTLKVDMITSADSSWYQSARQFKDLVEARSAGKITVVLHANGELSGGSMASQVQMLQDGEIDMVLASELTLGPTEPRLTVLSLPWLFSGYSAVDKFRASPMAQELLDMLKLHGIVGLAWGENGFRQLTNNKRPVTRPEDVKSLRIRVPPVTMYEEAWKRLDAEPKAFDFTEMPARIRDGTVDGQENPVDLIVSAQLYEVQSELSIWNWSYDGLIFCFSQKVWDRLDAATQQLIQVAAQEAAAYQVGLSRGVAQTQIAYLKDKGMHVTELTPEQINAFRVAMAPVYTEFESALDKDMIAKLQSLST